MKLFFLFPEYPKLSIGEALPLFNQILLSILSKQQLMSEFLLVIGAPTRHHEGKTVVPQFSATAEGVIKKLVDLIEISRGSWQFCCVAEFDDSKEKATWTNNMALVKLFVFTGVLMQQFEGLKNGLALEKWINLIRHLAKRNFYLNETKLETKKFFPRETKHETKHPKITKFTERETKYFAHI